MRAENLTDCTKKQSDETLKRVKILQIQNGRNFLIRKDEKPVFLTKLKTDFRRQRNFTNDQLCQKKTQFAENPFN